LLTATARQDIDEVRNLLQSGKYNPNTANEDGLTPIHQCSIDNSDKLLKLLIEYGGDVNAKDRDLWTPLHAAGLIKFHRNSSTIFSFFCLATCGHLQICRILVSNGAELLALNADGNMPYDICDDEVTLDYIETQMDRIGITQEMIDKTRAQTENQMLIDLENLVKKRSQNSLRSIDDILSYRNAEGVTPLHIASANGYQSVVEYLLKQHVSINLQDGDGWTPLHAAAFWCQQAIISKRRD
jgi:protein phosphatase 1 regulatory subunit 16A